MTPRQLGAALRRSTAAAHRVVRVESKRLAIRMESTAKTFARARLQKRTGQLVRSISAVHRVVAGGIIEAGVRGGDGTAETAHVRAQEEGAVIRPRDARFLAIPVNGALTGAGVPRFESPRQDPEIARRVFNAAGTAGVYLDKRGRVRWVLTRGPIRIPGKGFLQGAYIREGRAFPAQLEAAIAEALKGELQ